MILKRQLLTKKIEDRKNQILINEATSPTASPLPQPQV